MIKRLLGFLIGIICVLALSSIAQAAGSCTFDESRMNGIRVLRWTWTSDASGDVSGLQGKRVSGILYAVEFDVGTAFPSDSYDVSIIDGGNSADLDILNGLGTDLPNGDGTALSHAKCYRSILTTDGGYIPVVYKTLTPKVQNAGNAKSGTIYLYVAE